MGVIRRLKPNGKYGPKFSTQFAREKALLRVEEMYLADYTQAQIGRELGLSQPAVSGMVAELSERWRKTQVEMREEGVALLVAKLERLRRLAFEDYERIRRRGGKERQDEYGIAKALKKDGGKSLAKAKNTLRLLRRIVKRKETSDGMACLRFIKETYMDEARLRGWTVELNINVGAQVAPGWDVEPDDGAAGIIDVPAIEHKGASGG